MLPEEILYFLFGRFQVIVPVFQNRRNESLIQKRGQLGIYA